MSVELKKPSGEKVKRLQAKLNKSNFTQVEGWKSMTWMTEKLQVSEPTTTGQLVNRPSVEHLPLLLIRLFLEAASELLLT